MELKGKEKEEMKKAVEVIQRSLFSSFEAIVKACKTAQETYGYGTLTLTAFWHILDAGKWLGDDPRVEQINASYNNLLDRIYEDAKAQCKARGTQEVTLHYVEQIFEAFQTEYVDALKHQFDEHETIDGENAS